VPWTEIPLLLLVDLWRELIKECRLDDLIGRGRIPADELRKLERKLFQRLSESTTQADQGSSRPGEVGNLEFQLLKDRGIRVLDVSLPKIFLPTNIQEERLRAWREEWAGEIQVSLASAEQEIRRTKQRVAANTCQLLADSLTGELQQRLAEGAQIDWTETLTYLLQGAITISQNQDLIRDELQLATALRRIQEQLAMRESGSNPEVGAS
jgi:hypothetical protein